MNNRWKILGLTLIIIFFACASWLSIYFLGDQIGWVSIGDKLLVWVQIMLLLLILLLIPIIIFSRFKSKPTVKQENLKEESILDFDYNQLDSSATKKYGTFWRRKIKKVLVVGNVSNTEEILPGIIAEKWQLNNKLLLIWGEDLIYNNVHAKLLQLKKFFNGTWRIFRKPAMDGIIWVLPKDYLIDHANEQKILIETFLRQVAIINQTLKINLPIYILDVRNKKIIVNDNFTQDIIGSLLVDATNTEKFDIVENITNTINKCTDIGIDKTIKVKDSFMLQLSQDLEYTELSLLQKWLSYINSSPNLPLFRGFFITTQSAQLDEDLENAYLHNNVFTNNAIWQEINNNITQYPVSRSKVIGLQLMMSVFLCLSLSFSAGMICSYFNNKALIQKELVVIQRIQKKDPQSYVERLKLLNQTKIELAKLNIINGHAPLVYRFGLNKSQDLINNIIPFYYKLNNKEIIEPFTAWLQEHLHQVITVQQRLKQQNDNDKFEVANTTTTQGSKKQSDNNKILSQIEDDYKKIEPYNDIKFIKDSYDILKAYLMLGKPDKIDGLFLKRMVEKDWQPTEKINIGKWKQLAPELIQFWSKILPKYEQYSSQLDDQLITDVRTILLEYIGDYSVLDNIYNTMISNLKKDYTQLKLLDFLGDIEGKHLLNSNAKLSGLYTKEAWHGTVKQKIIATANSYANKQLPFWVLNDQEQTAFNEDTLKKYLIASYLRDYRNEWLKFLNTIQWNRSEEPSIVVNQLRMLADNKVTSPIFILLNEVKHQLDITIQDLNGITNLNDLGLTETQLDDKNYTNFLSSKSKHFNDEALKKTNSISTTMSGNDISNKSVNNIISDAKQLSTNPSAVVNNKIKSASNYNVGNSAEKITSNLKNQSINQTANQIKQMKSKADDYAQNTNNGNDPTINDDMTQYTNGFLLQNFYLIKQTFEPLIRLLDNKNQAISLQAYLLKITQIRLKLQKIINADLPEEQAQVVFKTMINNTAKDDKTSPKEYGEFIAATLGEDLSNFSGAVFKQPINIAMNVMAKPAAAGINNDWETNIYNIWKDNFAQHYPFRNTGSEVSLSELAIFLQPNVGIVDRFIEKELSAFLEKKGYAWVPIYDNDKALQLSPEFLKAIKTFNIISNKIFINGAAKIEFDIMPINTKLFRTELIIDGQEILYFNQMPVWQRVIWTGTNSPSAKLSWANSDNNIIEYKNYFGNWSWLRLLESATIKPIDMHTYELKWNVTPRDQIRYKLRTQSGRGPLDLLELRNLSFPKQIFIIKNKK